MGYNNGLYKSIKYGYKPEDMRVNWDFLLKSFPVGLLWLSSVCLSVRF
jgi:hypothetical protein